MEKQNIKNVQIEEWDLDKFVKEYSQKIIRKSTSKTLSNRVLNLQLIEYKKRNEFTKYEFQ